MWMFGFADSDSKNADKPSAKASAPTDEIVEPHTPHHFHEDDDSVSAEINKTLMVLLPWAISILFHLALILLAIFIGWTLVQQEEEEDLVVASPSVSPMPPSPLTPSLEQLEPQEQQRQTTIPRERPSQVTADVSVAVPSDVLGAMSDFAEPVPMASDTGSPDFFGVPTAAAGELPSRLVFVIDASGSLIDTFPFVLNEMKTFVRNLQPQQRFTILFYQGDRVIEVPPPGVKQATSETTQQVIDWIDTGSRNIVPGGSGNPVAALQKALSYRPQLIFLLSDNISGEGVYSVGQTALLHAIRQANVANTKISTIQFVYEDPLARSPGPNGQPLGEKGRTLFKISDMTGGIHQFVTGQELNIR